MAPGQTYPIIVGSGGSGGFSGSPNPGAPGANGNHSIFDTIISSGGGAGCGLNDSPNIGKSGGSGGGSSGPAPAGVAGFGNYYQNSIFPLVTQGNNVAQLTVQRTDKSISGVLATQKFVLKDVASFANVHKLD